MPNLAGEMFILVGRQ